MGHRMVEMPPAEKPSFQRFVVLDSFRGVSALFVALFHFHVYGHFYESAFIRNAYLFVGAELFFREGVLMGNGGGRLLFFYGNQWLVDLLAVIYITALILVSVITYRMIEYPFRDFVGRVAGIWSNGIPKVA